MVFLNFKKLSLKIRFIYSFVFVIIITITILSLTYHFRWNRNYLRQIRDEGLILTQTLAQGSMDPIIRNDFYTLDEYVKNLIKKKNIAYIVIMDRHDRVLAQSPEALHKIPQKISRNAREILSPYLLQTYYNTKFKVRINDISVPVLIDSKKWGTVRVGFSLAHMHAEITKNIYVVILTGLISLFIGISVALVLSRFVAGPIEKFARSMETVASGNYEQEIHMDTSDEFGALAKSFNQMAGSLRESKEELKKTYQRLMQKEKMAALGELTARIAHEIKNPLGIIKGSAQILVDKTENADVKIEVGEYIIDEVNRLDTKVRELLNHARPSTPNIQKVDLNKILEKRIQFWESQKDKAHQITIERKYDNDIPALHLDKEQFRQVILNLIINSCEAMPDGGKINITTGLSGTDKNNPRKGDQAGLNNHFVRIEFTDTGIGIPEQCLNRIFDPFFTTKKEGTGLGLSTVNRIIENHNGKIEVESKVGTGTRFFLFIPLKTNIAA